MLRGTTVIKSNPDFRPLVRDEQQVTERPERTIRNRVETGDEAIGRHPADTSADPRFSLAGGEAFAAHLVRHIRANDHNEVFANHRGLYRDA